jgi:hypothetical protein
MIQTVDDLYLINKKRKEDSHQIYKTLYVDVMNKIDKKNSASAYNLMYKPPTIILGNVGYNHKTCMLYLVRKLSKAGFIVFPVDTSLYIDWSFTVRRQKDEKLRKKVTFNL